MFLKIVAVRQLVFCLLCLLGESAVWFGLFGFVFSNVSVLALSSPCSIFFDRVTFYSEAEKKCFSLSTDTLLLFVNVQNIVQAEFHWCQHVWFLNLL